MIDEVLEDLQSSMTKAHEALKKDLARIRTGRANASILDSVRVDYFGSLTPIKQLASISVPEARALAVKAFDKTQVKAIDRAIRESNLGLNPQVDGDLIRIPMPALTQERRKELVKLAKRSGEDAKVSIRKARHDAKDALEMLKTEGEASEDDVDRGKKKLEEQVQVGTQRVDEIVAKKEVDILEV